MKIIFRHFVLALFLVCNLTLSAQTALKMRAFSMADGLPSNTITMMTKADNGMLWIATWNGLCNYDGYRFNSFVAPVGENQVLSGNRLHYIVPDNNGDVWITSSDDRLFLYDCKEREYIDYQEKLEQFGLYDFEVGNMHSLENGAVWVLGNNGQNLKIQNNHIEAIPTYQNEVAVCHRVVLTVDGSEWLVADDFVRRNGCDKKIMLNTSDIYNTGEGIVLLGNKIVIYNPSDDSYTEKTLPSDIKKVSSSKQMTGGNFAIATDAGIYIYNTGTETFTKVCTLSLDNIYCDKKDRLWSVLGNGTAVMVDTKLHQSEILDCTTPSDWPRISSQQAVVHEDTNGTVWMFLQGKTICR